MILIMNLHLLIALLQFLLIYFKSVDSLLHLKEEKSHQR